MRSEKKETNAHAWVSDMADTLIREILEQTAGLQLVRCPSPFAVGDEFFTVYSTVDGAFHTELVFSSEPDLFCRIASNMSGDPAPSQEEAVEYAMELFNMFCGRFISEIYRMTRVPARFYPPQYMVGTLQLDSGSVESLYYQDACGVKAKFSWTAEAIERLLNKGES